MGEFSLINQYFNWHNDSVDLGVGDDCALISIDPNQQLATSVDTLIEDVHFPKNTNPSDIAYKALAVNLSDLAAMGATPKYFTLALTLPSKDESWLCNFSNSLKSLAQKHQITLAGGDTTKGKLSISINVTGVVDKGKALLRSGAKVGDIIFVSNTIGDAALAWKQLQDDKVPSEELLKQFNTPDPQVLLGQKLLGVANSCIDISDGLEQDLSHILKHSNVGATLNLTDIPMSDEVLTYVEETKDWCLPLAGGDDYELCFTVSQSKLKAVEKIEAELGVSLSPIGIITKKLGIERLAMFDEDCQPYQHF